jgi:hypothetical protein
VRRLARQGALVPGKPVTWHWYIRDRLVFAAVIKAEVDALTLHYFDRADDPHPSVQYLSLDTTPCNYGGRRVWFICPQCGRRVAILYGTPFACRHCHQLDYRSQRETGSDRAVRRALAIRRRLGWPRGAVSGDKPKRMHQRTFERLVAQHDTYTSTFLAGVARTLKWRG